MVSTNRECKSYETRDTIISVTSSLSDTQEFPLELDLDQQTKFYGTFSDCMELSAPAPIVAEYLNNHNQWFSSCAQPMKVQPLGENGYELTIGRFGALGYEVEPKIGLELLPPQQGVYRIRTIPIPDYQPPGYDVDYRASLQLVESENQDTLPQSNPITKVEWELYLTVYVQFPKFINRLPKSLIQTTGDRLLNQIVRQVSRRLTRKVQDNFHQSLGR
ncbi:DUF1997 domain-containing protein [Plectonema cf. radiosum LEGE 06105]|uniref:DUF1997 domain-containing protein n=1 Tax=Plectonema cf. radiosum LEGE 06105 TaxID=945769 RepID=A0A8J7FIP9_9CYAN|nr:DUF1997 domain-containing protein [Plectonema radiosum]MBE9217043.1 DUF1997 domain-containing protein [Plectonema cf. radiosum LEGE 06105]